MGITPTETDSPDFSTQLWRLARFIRDAIKEAKARGELVETTETFVRRKISEFDYREGGNISLRWTDEFVEKPQWHWKHQEHFTEAVIKPSYHFRECAKILGQDTGPEVAHRIAGLDQFARAVSLESRNGCSDDKLVEYVAKFTRDQSSAPVDMHVSAWVDGLWLKDESIRLPNLILRRPTVHDLENEQRLSAAINPGFQQLRSLSSPPAIAEFKFKAISQPAAQDEVTRLMGALRLYRLGAVHAVSYSIAPDSITRFGTMHGAFQGLHASDRFPLESQESELLGRFLSKIKPLLPVESARNELSPQPADLGFVRFSDAVLKGWDLEGRITAAITCLEALFLKGKERTELAHKLSLRVACLLRLLKLNPIEVQGDVHRAYEIRSTYIHGGRAENDSLRGGQELCRRVLNYARLSTVIFLQLRDRTDKDEFLSKLDRALLEPKSLERIEKLLRELIIPK